MERINHLAYCRADQRFYENSDTARTGAPFPATERPAPDGWRRSETSSWLYVHPEHVQLPAQGWKIHVSATAADAAEVIDTVWEYCVPRSLSFKFLPHPQVHQAMNSKYAPRGGSGKLLTLYPADDASLERTLDELGSLLRGRQGPYILSDLRWREGPLYLRYGGFARRECLSESGERTLAIARPDGVLVPDERAPVFQVPDWAPVPGFIAEQIEAAPRPRTTTRSRTRWRRRCTTPTAAASTWPRTTTPAARSCCAKPGRWRAWTVPATTPSPGCTGRPTPCAGWPTWTPYRTYWAPSPPGNTTSWYRSSSRGRPSSGTCPPPTRRSNRVRGRANAKRTPTPSWTSSASSNGSWKRSTPPAPSSATSAPTTSWCVRTAGSPWSTSRSRTGPAPTTPIPASARPATSPSTPRASTATATPSTACVSASSCR